MEQMIFKSRQNFNATCNIYPNGEIPPNLVTLLGLLKRALKATLLTGGGGRPRSTFVKPSQCIDIKYVHTHLINKETKQLYDHV
jgi:hypothetical protein